MGLVRGSTERWTTSQSSRLVSASYTHGTHIRHSHHGCTALPWHLLSAVTEMQGSITYSTIVCCSPPSALQHLFKSWTWQTHGNAIRTHTQYSRKRDNVVDLGKDCQPHVLPPLLWPQRHDIGRKRTSSERQVRSATVHALFLPFWVRPGCSEHRGRSTHYVQRTYELAAGR